MSEMTSAPRRAEAPDPHDGWGDVPVADRPRWTRTFIDHLPWFPGVAMFALCPPGVTDGRASAPPIWKDAAKALHAAGFAPADYYLLAELLASRLDLLDADRHSGLFELWPTDARFRSFRLRPARWVPWLEAVRAGESPRLALEGVLGVPLPRTDRRDPQQ